MRNPTSPWSLRGENMANPNKNGARRPKKLKPHFKQLERELWFGGVLVKKFRQLAAAQEQILIAFEEQHWHKIVDDPLPHVAHVDPKRRLHDAIRNLNKYQLK